MIKFPNCKINLGLHVTQKRADGFHDIETVFYPVAINDVLEIITSKNNTTQLHSSGIGIAGNANDNLCIKAYNLLKQGFNNLPAVDIYLQKNIPAGAGLGGGSADGAYTLLLLNEKYNLGLSEQQLINYALRLGSDCPFFIKNTPCYATGRGEVLQPVDTDLSGYKIVIINPGIHINTGRAFSNITPARPQSSLQINIALPVTRWKNIIVNDFETAVFAAHPSMQKIKEDLYAAGAVYAAMTGTGSTFFGVFNKDEKVNVSVDKSWMLREVEV